MDHKMKAISLWQPWASLIRTGIKKIETRGTSIRHRGPLLIHAAKRRAPWWIVQEISDALLRAGHGPMTLQMPLGCLLCKVDVIDCKRVNTVNRPPENQLPWGDFSEGRYMWILDNLETFHPVLYRGMQGLFHIPDDVVDRIEFRRAE